MNKIRGRITIDTVQNICCEPADSVLIDKKPISLWANILELDENMHQVCLSCVFSSSEIPEDEVDKRVLESYFGIIDAEYEDFCGYSEWTPGWFNEEFEIGNHDILKILRSHEGEWCELRIVDLKGEV